MEKAVFCTTFALACLFSKILLARGALYIQAQASVVSEGTQTTLNCYNDGLSDPNIFNTGGTLEWCRTTRYSGSLERVAMWTRDGGERILLSDPEGRFSVEGGLSTHEIINQRLNIRNTSKVDQGSYYCLLYRGDGTEEARSANLALTVRFPPAEYYPLCTATPDGLGNEVTLTCRSEITTPAVTIQWFKNDVKVADGLPVGLGMESTYEARTDELGSQFECRLYYSDEYGIEVRRSCRFSRPYVAILRDSELEGKYHAFAHPNPPFVSDINCYLESASSNAAYTFQSEFPGYGIATVGPLMPADNGSGLVCRAKNVFGWGETRMTVYSYGDGTHGETTIPSVVTNYMPNIGTLEASVSPRDPMIPAGGNATFYCSYGLTVHAPSQATVAIGWKYNDIAITASTPKFQLVNNAFNVIGVFEEDDEARVTCTASMIVDETTVVNVPPSESTTIIRVSHDQQINCNAHHTGCRSEPVTYAVSSSFFNNPSFAIGISIIAVVAFVIIIVLCFLIAAQHKKQSRARFIGDEINSEMTFRGGRTTTGNQTTTPATTIRALPAHPPTNNATVDTMSKPQANLQVATPVEASKPEMAYQEMVGHTGVTKARNGSIAHGVPVPGGIGHGTHNGSVQGPPLMVPVPTGGFVPQTLVGNGQNNEKKSGLENGDTNYEDLDCMRQQRPPRATGNDYQTSISNSPCPREELEPLHPHYANS